MSTAYPNPQQQPPWGGGQGQQPPWSQGQAAAQQARWAAGGQQVPGRGPRLDEVQQNEFMTRVFGWMTMGLGLTAFMAWMVASNEVILAAVAPWIMPLAILTLVMVFGLSFGINKLSSGAATGIFLAYASILGVVLAPILLIYTGASVAATFGVTTATFGFMFVWGWTTKKDLTKMGSLLFMALIGIILASIVNIFMASSALYWIITYAGVLIFVGLIAYDAQKIKAMNAYGDAGSEIQKKNAILGALTLYLDFINLFLFLLRILGDRR